MMNIKSAFTLSLMLLLSSTALVNVAAQQKAPDTAKAAPASSIGASAKATITATTSPIELARAALMAQGGDKFRNLKSLVLLGSVELYAPNSTQSLPGKFAIVNAGERFRQEIQSPIFNFRQIYDGQQNYSSIRGMEFPPPSKYGLLLLTKFDQPGYSVTALPDNKKKQRAFRITDPEGNATDFYVDPATGRVVSFIFNYGGFTFGIEHKSLKEVEGVLVPYVLTQKLETPQGDFFAELKVKDVKVNQAISEDLFIIPSK